MRVHTLLKHAAAHWSSSSTKANHNYMFTFLPMLFLLPLSMCCLFPFPLPAAVSSSLDTWAQFHCGARASLCHFAWLRGVYCAAAMQWFICTPEVLMPLWILGWIQTMFSISKIELCCLPGPMDVHEVLLLGDREP